MYIVLGATRRRSHDEGRSGTSSGPKYIKMIGVSLLEKDIKIHANDTHAQKTSDRW